MDEVEGRSPEGGPSTGSGQDGPTKGGAAAGVDDIMAILPRAEDLPWFSPQGAYRAVLKFGETDSATICCIGGGVIAESLAFLARLWASLAKVDRADDGVFAAAVLDVLEGEQAEEVWNAVDAIFACGLSKWHMPELGEVYFPETDAAPCPNAAMDAGPRMALLKRLPLTVVVRIVVGCAVLAGNSLRRSTAA